MPQTIRAPGRTPAATILRVSIGGALTRRHRATSSRSTGHGCAETGMDVSRVLGLLGVTCVNEVTASTGRAVRP